MTPAVAHSGELQRILSLPRRVWPTKDLEELTDSLTDIFRTPSGKMRLHPQQAVGLLEAGTEQGLFSPLGVGEGKTLLSFLLPAVFDAKRPMILCPSGMVEKTKDDYRELAVHWRLPPMPRVFGYQMLGLVQAKEVLEQYQPDLLIPDELQRLKNKRAAVTRVVARYMHNHPTTWFCGLSGSPMDKSVKDMFHLILWCLKTKAPVPFSVEDQEQWAEALDENVDPMMRRAPGALLSFCNAEERAKYPPHIAARHGFRRRLTETPGVVATVGEGVPVKATIHVREIRHRVAPETEKHFAKLRYEMKTPDEWELFSGAEVWQHAQELALGLYYVWNPRPPKEWLTARRNWNAYWRATVGKSRTFDSALHVANACDAGRLDSGGTLEAWRKLEPTFKPNVEAVWCDDYGLKVCRDWAAKEPGLVWTGHNLFAQRLALYTALPYYGAKGLDAKGNSIRHHKPGTSAIASIDACREGLNLQRIWSRNLVVQPPTSAAWWEQLMARTHRTGQEAKQVIVDVLIGCRENYDAVQSAIANAHAITAMTGKKQKLLMADIVLPPEHEIAALNTPRWNRTLGGTDAATSRPWMKE